MTNQKSTTAVIIRKKLDKNEPMSAKDFFDLMVEKEEAERKSQLVLEVLREADEAYIKSQEKPLANRTRIGGYHH